MADFNFEIEEFIGSLKESDKHDWAKCVTRMKWNDGPANIDIRNINMSQNRIGKGISLSDEEADKLVDLLLEKDYGSLEAIKNALTKKTKRFTVSKDACDCFDEDMTITIEE